MEYDKALKIYEIVEEMKQNDVDVGIFNNAKRNGIESVQIQIRDKNGNYYSSTIYNNNRINLLLGFIDRINDDLMKKLSEI